MKEFSQQNRIKYYRLKLGVTQKQIIDGKISKSYFQALESNRKKLTLRKAMFLADVINRIANERGVDIKINAQDLMGL